jgi:hypothetical protein
MSGIIDTVGSKSGIVGSDVYPAGHVIQVVHHFSTSAASTSSTTGVTAVSGAIILSNATNKIWAMASVTASTAKTTANDTYFGFTFECTSATTITYGPKDGTGYYAVRLNGAGTAGAVNIGAIYTMNEIFEPDLVGSITVTLKGHSYPSTNSTLTVNPNATSHGRSTLTLMELAAT